MRTDINVRNVPAIHCELVHLRGSRVKKAVHDGSLEEAMLTAT